MSVLVDEGVIRYLGPDDGAPEPGAAKVIDAGGATIVPGMVDAHSHVTCPGGSHWIARIDDSTEDLLNVAEHNGDLMFHSGTRWARDVGSPRRVDPESGVEQGLALTVRDRWAGHRHRPYVRAAGTWLGKTGTLPSSVAIEADHADDLVAAVEQQLADGTDLIKLYLDGPEAGTSPWTAAEVARAVAPAHEIDIGVTAHATQLAGARAGVEGGVDCIEHGSELDADLASLIASTGTFVVPTLGVLASWETFATTTDIERFTGDEGKTRLAARKEVARESVRIAHAAGVPMAAGTDFGGGSLRANQMAWEVEELVAAGLEPWEALAAATWRGGELLGEPDAGLIRRDGPADFFMVHGNPLDDPSALWRVWRVAR